MKKVLLFGTALLLQTAGFAQLQNTSFELWENPITNFIASNRPVGWTRTNGIPGSENFNFYHDAVTPAQDGNYALRLSIWYSYDKDMAKQVAPIDYRPAALTGFYTYTNNQVLGETGIIDDEAEVTVTLTKNDPSTGEKILIGLGTLTFVEAQTTFAPFTCTINYVSDQVPDTIEVLFDCTIMDKVNPTIGVEAPHPSFGVCSLFTIDNISLTAETLSTEVFLNKDIKIYPNPATNVVYVSGFEGEARIYDMTGKQVATTYTRTGSVDISAIAKGVYLLSLTDKSGTHNAKIIKH